MTFHHFMKPDYKKSLIALCMTLQITACSQDEVELGTLTVDWTPPMARSKGEAMSPSEIGGYRVYYGRATGDYSNKLDIFGGAVTQATVTAPQGRYYYVVTSFDYEGRESAFSAEFETNI